MNTILIIVEADSQSGPYKAVPAPKPLANPPPYRQPPPPANSSSPVLAAARPHLHHNDPSVAAPAASAAAGPAATSESNPKSAGHGLLAHSSKFPVRLFSMLTTSSPNYPSIIIFIMSQTLKRLMKLNEQTKRNLIEKKKEKSLFFFAFAFAAQLDFRNLSIHFEISPRSLLEIFMALNLPRLNLDGQFEALIAIATYFRMQQCLYTYMHTYIIYTVCRIFPKPTYVSFFSEIIQTN